MGDVLDDPEKPGARLTVASIRSGAGGLLVTATGEDGRFVADGPA